MEQKTIGKFITALRKANGLTQKELAEKLNVSDKTVSRWERDEGAPDLSLIPVLAEIFGVSCDELLRGERRPPAERTVQEESDPLTAKGEKQRRRLLRLAASRYRSWTCAAIGLSAVGLLTALICNLAFTSAVLGFLAGAVFLAAGVVCQCISVNRALLSVEEAELEPDALSRFRREVIRLAQIAVGVTVAVFGFTFPLILVDAYMGLGADSLLIFGGLGAAAALLLYAVVLYFVNASLLRRGIYTLEEKEAAAYHHNHRLKKYCAAALLGVMTVTAALHMAMTTVYGPGSIMEATVFHDYESFVAFMEQDIPRAPETHFQGGSTAAEPAAPAEEIVGETTYYDENGNEISEEEFLRRNLKDIGGNVVCEYTARNKNICRISYSPKEGTVLPITVSTYDQLQQAQAKAQVRHVYFAAAYVLEAAAAVIVYFAARKKLR